MNIVVLLIGILIFYFVFAAPGASPTATANSIYAKYKFPIDIASNLRSIPVKRIVAMIAVESNGNPDARGLLQERGLMQISVDAMIEVNTRYGYSFSFDELFDPANNILVGVTYLDWLRNNLSHDLDMGTQAYNAGLFSVQVNRI